MDKKQINQRALDEEAKHQSEVFKECRKEKEIWRLKSRSTWLKAGDRNVAYFHKQARMRRNHNHIHQLHGENGIIKGQDQLKEAARTHFKNLYSEEGEEEHSLSESLLKNIDPLLEEEEIKEMEKEFQESEVCDVIWGMDPDKAPGPDGFIGHFYRSSWDIIKKYLMRLIRNFHKKGKLGGGINSAFLFLNPKESNPSN